MNSVILVLFVGCFLSCHTSTTANWNLSKEDDLKFEKQLKLLNKPAIKTIKTEYGDVFDCVDFFRQPAFDHPLLKNYTSDFKVLPPSILNSIRTRTLRKVMKNENTVLNGLDCPVGTVPIRRVTKEELIRDTLSSEASALENGQTRVAVDKTKGTGRYSGAGAVLSIHNPQVTGTQSSSSRIRITNGPDSIQAGWRVDKLLQQGTTQTRLFVHTKAGGTQCFNTLCPGFVVVRPDLPPGLILTEISVPGGRVYAIPISINRDEHGNWNLYIEKEKTLIGYWPARLFTGLSGLASSLEWGGEVYSPPGIPFPAMGSGLGGVQQDTRYDSFFSEVTAFNEAGQGTDTMDLEWEVTVGNGYYAVDEGVVDDKFKRLILYGGAPEK